MTGMLRTGFHGNPAGKKAAVSVKGQGFGMVLPGARSRPEDYLFCLPTVWAASVMELPLFWFRSLLCIFYTKNPPGGGTLVQQEICR